MICSLAARRGGGGARVCRPRGCVPRVLPFASSRVARSSRRRACCLFNARRCRGSAARGEVGAPPAQTARHTLTETENMTSELVKPPGASPALVTFQGATAASLARVSGHGRGTQRGEGAEGQGPRRLSGQARAEARRSRRARRADGLHQLRHRRRGAAHHRREPRRRRRPRRAPEPHVRHGAQRHGRVLRPRRSRQQGFHHRTVQGQGAVHARRRQRVRRRQSRRRGCARRGGRRRAGRGSSRRGGPALRLAQGSQAPAVDQGHVRRPAGPQREGRLPRVAPRARRGRGGRAPDAHALREEPRDLATAVARVREVRHRGAGGGREGPAVLPVPRPRNVRHRDRRRQENAAAPQQGGLALTGPSPRVVRLL